MGSGNSAITKDEFIFEEVESDDEDELAKEAQRKQDEKDKARADADAEDSILSTKYVEIEENTITEPVKNSTFAVSYGAQRDQLRKALIYSFKTNEANRDILHKIKGLRTVICNEAPLFNKTAVREIARAKKFEITNIETAQRELDRLYNIFETGRILRSVKGRNEGNAACPLGHHVERFRKNQHPSCAALSPEELKLHTVMCGICTKQEKEGYHCHYCDFNICRACQPIYCSEGHVMILWTHAESTHQCIVCDNKNITSGYYCGVCEQYNICDMCTWLDGRLFVQKVIRQDIAEILKWMEDWKVESETARNTLNDWKSLGQTEKYTPTIILFQKLLYYRGLKEQVKLEVTAYQIKMEIMRLREIYIVDWDINMTALREKNLEPEISKEEIARYQALIKAHTRALSQVIRSKTCFACPLGHAAFPFIGCPDIYRKRWEAEFGHLIPKASDTSDLTNRVVTSADVLKMTEESSYDEMRRKLQADLDDIEFPTDEKVVVEESKIPPKPYVKCFVCTRACIDGYHCEICEYEVCGTCKVVYCLEGHERKMWTEPGAIDMRCSNCGAEELTRGYHCSLCETDICDRCTMKVEREKLRDVWEREMKEILKYMDEVKGLSDIAQYYHWRHVNYIVSQGLLVGHVKELREAKVKAAKEVKYRPILVKIKKLRKKIIHHPELCAVSARELVRSETVFFTNRKVCIAEFNRLRSIIADELKLKSIEARLSNTIGCPLGHCMTITPYDEFAHENPKLNCRACFGSAIEGNVCDYCEYNLCHGCSVMYCRDGHATQMWIEPLAFNVTCNVCFTVGITSGYRCNICSTDICDLCTRKDARDALRLYPKREVMKTLEYFDTIKYQSHIALAYLEKEKLDIEKSYLDSMTFLCHKLQEVRTTKKEAEEEIRLKIIVKTGVKFGTLGRDN